MTLPERIVFLMPNEGQTLALGTTGVKFKAVGTDTGGAYTMMELTLPPGGGSALHIHHGENESFFLLNGTLTICIGDEVFSAAVGSFTLIPKGVLHAFVNRGDEPVRALVTVAPAGLEGFFLAASDPAVASDPSRIADLLTQYQLEFFGPPPA